jgi:hypothetical protein
MSDSAVPSPATRSATRSRRGQTLVEFALLLPLLIVLFMGIADFGRVFSDGLILEAAARNGAELAAQEYAQLYRTRPSHVLTAADYDYLHDIALEGVCEEATKLTNEVMVGGSCSMPFAAVCIHDVPGGDGANCGAEATGAPAQCDRVAGPPVWNPLIEPGQAPHPDLELAELPYVEVRLCYRFLTLFNLTNLQLPLMNGLNIGEIWLQRDRVFVSGIY